MREISNIRVMCIRHGESEGNIDKGIYLEKSDWDIELSEGGRKECEEKRGVIGGGICDIMGGEIDIVYYSPYRRSKDTAGIIFGGYGIEFREEALLVERNWGDSVVKDFGFFFRPDGKYGESFFDLYKRVYMFYEYLHRIYGSNVEKDKIINIILVTHGEWIKMFDKVVKGYDIEEFGIRSKEWKIKNLEYFIYDI